MKARSPENGFDEIRDLFKDDESTVLDDLDLSFFINKDLAPGYLFDDLTGYDSYNNIQFNEQGQPPELPSLPLSFGDYDIPGPSTRDDLNSTAESGFHAEVLPDSDVIQDQNLPSEPNKDNNDVDLDQDVQNIARTEFVATFDDDQAVKNVDGIRSPPPTDEIVDETCFEAIQDKMNDFELCFIEENEASISHVVPEVDLESEVRLINDSKNMQKDANEEPNKCADIDENQTHDKSVSAEMPLCTPQSLDDQEYSAPDSLFHQDECFDQKQDAQYQDHKETCRTSRKRKCEVAGGTISCAVEEINFKKLTNSSDSSPPRDKYTHSSLKRIRRSVSPPSNRREDRYTEHRRERHRSKSRSPCVRDYYHRRKRYPSRSHSSRFRSPRTRYSPPGFFRGTGLGKPGTCLFVAGLCFSLSEWELARKFSRFGRIRDVRIIRDKRSGRSRGYGFLSLEKSEEADAAIRAIHRTEWNGRMILVEKSIPK